MSSADDHTTAQAVHDLGAALWFGGTVMGVAGVNKSGNDLPIAVHRIRVANSAWNRFAPAQWAGIGAVLVAGSQLTAASKGRIAAQQDYGTVGALKIGVVLAGAASTAYASYCGHRIGAIAEEIQASGQRLEVRDVSRPAPTTPDRLARWQRRQRRTQLCVPLLAAANIVCNAYLVQSYRVGATARGVLGRVLPG
ncbi:hypothetical protein GTR02_16935 [Kineococcus sp. R8]|uniref:hypothetical protein n=1 Tax=Kineococcus siccus TaxID=2696567 RepID=UPI001411B884|nr:hypothetical protein [Kineococcus siccus]NAZ83504.1 hypothetical protein [Kineococcus siccus]